MDREGRNKDKEETWQWAKHARLYSDLLQAYAAKALPQMREAQGNETKLPRVVLPQLVQKDRYRLRIMVWQSSEFRPGLKAEKRIQ